MRVSKDFVEAYTHLGGIAMLELTGNLTSSESYEGKETNVMLSKQGKRVYG